MSVVKQWGAEIARFAPSLRVHSHHGSLRLAGAALVEARPDVGRRRHLVRHRHARRRLPRRDRLGPAAARRGAGRQEPEHEAGARAAPAAGAAAAGDDRHADREPPQRAVGADGHRQPRPARLAGVVRARVRAADRDAQPRRRARAAAVDRAAVHPPPREGRARGRAGAAADHGRQGLLPADGRAGEPVPRDGRPLAAADRGARRPLRPPRRRARDAQPPEAGVQPPRDAGRDRAAARRPLREAGAAAGAAGAGARGRQGARLHAVPGLRPARAAPRGAARPQRRLLPRPPQRAAARAPARGVRHRGRADAARDLDPRRRPRPQPAGREPRLPLRPLVEPGRRAAGDRPRAPVRPAQARLRAQPDLHRNAGGADRRAARLEAGARGEGDRRPLRGLARRSRPRRAAGRRRAVDGSR